MDSNNVVIVGAGHASGQVVATLKQKNFEGQICLIGEEGYLPYQRPPLSKKYLAGELPPERLHFKADNFYDEPNIAVHLDTKVIHPRLGLEPEEVETVSWLVRWHLAMSSTAFKRDLNDPKAIQDFVELVQSPERLRLLLILTVADIRAVGPSVWNGWKGQLLRELYARAEEWMLGGHANLKQEDRPASA